MASEGDFEDAVSDFEGDEDVIFCLEGEDVVFEKKFAMLDLFSALSRGTMNNGESSPTLPTSFLTGKLPVNPLSPQNSRNNTQRQTHKEH